LQEAIANRLYGVLNQDPVQFRSLVGSMAMAGNAPRALAGASLGQHVLSPANMGRLAHGLDDVGGAAQFVGKVTTPPASAATMGATLSVGEARSRGAQIATALQAFANRPNIRALPSGDLVKAITDEKTRLESQLGGVADYTSMREHASELLDRLNADRQSVRP
jgi:hypothetical protein